MQLEPENPIALHLLGLVAFQAGKYEIAEELITKAIEIKADHDEAHNNLGTLLESTGRVEESITHYEMSLAIEPGIAEIHYNLGNVLRVLGRKKEAPDVMQKKVADQECQTEALLEFCGLDWNAACLTYYQAARAVKTVSAVQVRQPIYKDSVELWKQYERQLAPSQKSLKGEL